MKPISCIMLAHNEAGTIEEVVRSYHERVVSRIPGSEFIIAEDGSTDGTREVLSGLSHELPLRLILESGRKGYARAFRDALSLPRNEIIFLSDSGGKHDPADFWKLYEKMSTSDMVIGVKTNRQDSWFRRLMTWGYNRAVNWYFKTGFHDIDSGFRLVRKAAAEAVLNEPWSFRELIASEFTLRVAGKGFKIVEEPISYRARAGASRGLPLKKIPGVILHVLSSFSRLKRELDRSHFHR